MTPKEILVKAKHVILERGWTQHTFESENGCVCMYGAINVAAYGDAWPVEGLTELPEEDAAVAVLRAYVPNGDIALFNDTTGRQVSNVLAVFDRAIAEVSS